MSCFCIKLQIFWASNGNKLQFYHLNIANYLNALKNDSLKIDDIFSYILDKYLLNQTHKRHKRRKCKQNIIYASIYYKQHLKLYKYLKN